MEDVIVQHSDTQGTPFGYGSYGSRTLVGGQHGRGQGRRQDQARRPEALRGAHAGGAARGHRGRRRAATSSRARRTRRRRSRRSPSRPTSRFDRRRGWSRTSTRPPTTTRPNCTWPFGTHIAIVEVDEETGLVDLVRYIAVDDVGKKINPMIVDGQLHGGIAQGVGQALWEGAVYDDERPAAVGLDARLRPAARVLAARASSSTRRSRPSPVNPLGRQGRGRGRRHRQHRRRRSTRSSTRSSPLGIRHLDMPLHLPDRLARHAGRGGEPRHDPGRSSTTRARPRSRRRCASSPGRTTGPRSSAGGRACCRCSSCASRRPGRSSTSAGSRSCTASASCADGGVAIGAAGDLPRRCSSRRWSPSGRRC